MEQRLSLVTLGVADLERARAFYEALGWRSYTPVELEVVFFQSGGMVFALWDRDRLAEDSGVVQGGGYGGWAPALQRAFARRGRRGHRRGEDCRCRDHPRARGDVLGRLLGRVRRSRRL